MGEWLKELLERRHINVSSVAAVMKPKRSKGAFQKYYASQIISDKVLKEISAAIGFDLYSMAMEERARRTIGAKDIGAEQDEMVSEPAVRYGHVRAGGHEAFLITLNMDNYDEADQLKIVRFVQQLPRKGTQRKATGS